jgi:hypothetical protein
VVAAATVAIQATVLTGQHQIQDHPFYHVQNNIQKD